MILSKQSKEYVRKFYNLPTKVFVALRRTYIIMNKSYQPLRNHKENQEKKNVVNMELREQSRFHFSWSVSMGNRLFFAFVLENNSFVVFNMQLVRNYFGICVTSCCFCISWDNDFSRAAASALLSCLYKNGLKKTLCMLNRNGSM